eukprot:6200662-Pleurochrysis_carterae.AAC.1
MALSDKQARFTRARQCSVLSLSTIEAIQLHRALNRSHIYGAPKHDSIAGVRPVANTAKTAPHMSKRESKHISSRGCSSKVDAAFGSQAATSGKASTGSSASGSAAYGRYPNGQRMKKH